MIGVYKITNVKNNKIYVGQSNDIYRRFYEHQTKENLLESQLMWLYRNMVKIHLYMKYWKNATLLNLIKKKLFG